MTYYYFNNKYNEILLTSWGNSVSIDKKLSPALIAQRLKQECAKRSISCTPCDIRNWTQTVQKSGLVYLKD